MIPFFIARRVGVAGYPNVGVLAAAGQRNDALQARQGGATEGVAGFFKIDASRVEGLECAGTRAFRADGGIEFEYIGIDSDMRRQQILQVRKFGCPAACIRNDCLERQLVTIKWARADSVVANSATTCLLTLLQ